MGTDYSHCAGVLVRINDFALRLEITREQLLTFKDQMLSEEWFQEACFDITAEDCWDDESAGTALDFFRKIKNRQQFRMWLSAFSSAEDGDFIERVIGKLLAHTHLELPKFSTVFSHSEDNTIQDFPGEHGVLYLCFAAEKCFEKTLSPQGKRLAKFCDAEPVEKNWLTISY